MLVPTDKDEGLGGDVHYMTVEQDPDQSPEGCLSACADEGKPMCFIETSELIIAIYVHLRSGVD
jgi:hypothetical protein